MGKKRTLTSDEHRRDRETEPAEKPVKIPDRTLEEALRDLMEVEPDADTAKPKD